LRNVASVVVCDTSILSITAPPEPTRCHQNLG